MKRTPKKKAIEKENAKRMSGPKAKQSLNLSNPSPIDIARARYSQEDIQVTTEENVMKDFLEYCTSGLSKLCNANTALQYWLVLTLTLTYFKPFRAKAKKFVDFVLSKSSVPFQITDLVLWPEKGCIHPFPDPAGFLMAIQSPHVRSMANVAILKLQNFVLFNVGQANLPLDSGILQHRGKYAHIYVITIIKRSSEIHYL
jgi:hypothetical protein